MSTLKSVLLLGMKPLETDPNSPWNMETVKKALEAEVSKGIAAGFELVPFSVDPANEQIVDEVRKALRSRKWDVVSVGFGIRSNPSLTPLFEDLVNACIEEVQPTPKLAFALTPTTAVDAIERVFSK